MLFARNIAVNNVPHSRTINGNLYQIASSLYAKYPMANDVDTGGEDREEGGGGHGYKDAET